MTRAKLDSNSRTEIGGHLVRECLFFHIAMPSGTLAYTTDDAPHTFADSAHSIASTTFTPASLGTLENLNENTTGHAERATLTLSGCDSTVIGNMVGDASHFVKVRIWIGYLDGNGVLVSTTPYCAFDGLLGSPYIQTGDNTSVIQISFETKSVLLMRVSQVRACDADQQARGFSGSADLFFHQVSVNGKRATAFGNRRNDGGNIGGDGSGGPGGRGPASPVVSPPPGQPIFPIVSGVGV